MAIHVTHNGPRSDSDPREPEIFADLSPHLMASAALFARNAKRVASPPNPQIETMDECWSYVLGGIMTACSATEALANEVFLRVVVGGGDFPVDPAVAATVKADWSKIERFNTLKKLNHALKLAKLLPYIPGTEPFESASLGFELRNMLVHYKTRDIDQPPAHEIANSRSCCEASSRCRRTRAAPPTSFRTDTCCTSASPGLSIRSWRSSTTSPGGCGSAQFA